MRKGDKAAILQGRIDCALTSWVLHSVSDPKLTVYWSKLENHILPQTMELNFITFTNPDETRKADSRRFIRTQVLKRYHAKRRSDKQKKLETIPTQRTLVARNGESQTPLISGKGVDLDYVAVVARVPSPETCLNPGLVDAFCVLPINLFDNDRFFLDRCEYHQFHGFVKT